MRSITESVLSPTTVGDRTLFEKWERKLAARGKSEADYPSNFRETTLDVPSSARVTP
jgi:hypothetical protein